MRAARTRRFRSAEAFRRWLAEHHASEEAVVIHCYKVAHASKGMTYRQAVDEALSVGWIDGITRAFDDTTFLVRFTPRRPRSNWSPVNVAKVKRLIASGRMKPAGLAAFQARRRTPGTVPAAARRKPKS